MQESFTMRRSKPHPIRNKLNLSDRTQVRLVRKHLGLSDSELTAIVGKIGNSLSAISKEVSLQRASALAETTDAPPAVVIVSVTAADQDRAELATGQSAS
jgi:hypothetical protein